MVKTGAQLSKEWRKRNPEKIKAYNKMRYARDKEKILEYSKNYGKEYEKRTNYARFKTHNNKKIQAIKRKTRNISSLENKYCIFCTNKAVHRHHTTEPMEFDKFIFLCKDCHLRVHRNMKECLAK